MGLEFKRIKLVSVLAVLTFYCVAAEASWQSYQVVLSGGWGNLPDQFGIEYDDTGAEFPREVIVLANDDIWIPDSWVNERLKLYDSSGNLKKIIALDKATRTFPEYWFVGKFAAIGSDGSVYMSDYMGKKQYAQYSPSGQLIKTSTTRPPELGVISEKPLANRQYKVTVKYPDKEWTIIGKGAVPKYSRDINGNLYGSGAKQAIRYSYCGKELARLTMPKANIQEISRGAQLDPKIIVLEEYGSPIIGPNGAVYTWKRTPDTYSILKWTWVDDPNVPSGPDAPTGLSVMPSTTGLYLTWTASPQDPGCATGYEISRATSAGGIGTTIATVNAGVVKYNDTSTSAGTTYYYKVRAKAGSEYSNYTSEVSGKR